MTTKASAIVSGRLLAVALSYTCALCRVAVPNWDKANQDIVRLSPAKFRQLPVVIRNELSRRGCTIPQPWGEDKTRNVIRGEFIKRGELDWAVLCSRNGVSEILLFRNSFPVVFASLARLPDSTFLQGLGDSRIGYSRSLAAVGRDTILSDYKAFGGKKPPPIDHQGIDDMFLGKASTIWYLYRNKWLALQGAD